METSPKNLIIVLSLLILSLGVSAISCREKCQSLQYTDGDCTSHNYGQGHYNCYHGTYCYHDFTTVSRSGTNCTKSYCWCYQIDYNCGSNENDCNSKCTSSGCSGAGPTITTSPPVTVTTIPTNTCADKCKGEGYVYGWCTDKYYAAGSTHSECTPNDPTGCYYNFESFSIEGTECLKNIYCTCYDYQKNCGTTRSECQSRCTSSGCSGAPTTVTTWTPTTVTTWATTTSLPPTYFNVDFSCDKETLHYSGVGAGEITECYSTTSGGASPYIYKWTVGGIGKRIGVNYHDHVTVKHDTSHGSSGTISLTLKVTDNQGQTGTKTKTISVLSGADVCETNFGYQPIFQNCPAKGNYNSLLKSALGSYLNPSEEPRGELYLGEMKDIIKVYVLEEDLTLADCSLTGYYSEKPTSGILGKVQKVGDELDAGFYCDKETLKVGERTTCTTTSTQGKVCWEVSGAGKAVGSCANTCLQVEATQEGNINIRSTVCGYGGFSETKEKTIQVVSYAPTTVTTLFPTCKKKCQNLGYDTGYCTDNLYNTLSKCWPEYPTTCYYGFDSIYKEDTTCGEHYCWCYNYKKNCGGSLTECQSYCTFSGCTTHTTVTTIPGGEEPQPQSVTCSQKCQTSGYERGTCTDTNYGSWGDNCYNSLDCYYNFHSMSGTNCNKAYCWCHNMDSNCGNTVSQCNNKCGASGCAGTVTTITTLPGATTTTTVSPSDLTCSQKCQQMGYGHSYCTDTDYGPWSGDCLTTNDCFYHFTSVSGTSCTSQYCWCYDKVSNCGSTAAQCTSKCSTSGCGAPGTTTTTTTTPATGTNCWSAYIYLERTSAQMKKFCKCVEGRYAYKGFWPTTSGYESYQYYTDSADNTNWARGVGSRQYRPVYKVICSDSNTYFVNQNYYYSGGGGTTTTTTLGPIDTPCDEYQATGKLPKHFDWRNYNGQNYMTPVKNQENCGSCWAFSAVGAMEAKYKIEQKNPGLNPDLSEQYLVSCSLTGGCYGGWPYNAFAYIKNAGICDEDCFPYQDKNTGKEVKTKVPCNSKCADWNSRLWRISNYKWVPLIALEEERIRRIKEALICHGPLSIASLDWWHPFVLVGYHDYPGDSEVGGYWIFKNSYGIGYSRGWEHGGYGTIDYRGDPLSNLIQVYYPEGVTPPA